MFRGPTLTGIGVDSWGYGVCGRISRGEVPSRSVRATYCSSEQSKSAKSVYYLDTDQSAGNDHELYW